MSNYTITFACYNSLDYTKKCVESLLRANISLDRVVVVDNDSTDATFEYL
ncbi:MAG: glycosyltransferase, partial [Betaproteobacteria bacterium]